jgi:hypothetical protein
MSLSFDLGNGDAVGLVGPAVFAIGFDEKYIVLMQHPALNTFASSFDRGVTNYFIVDRTTSTTPGEREKGVRGPLSKVEFERLASSLSLPPFTKRFDDLE